MAHRVALVTGASRGIGNAVARKLASAGRRVVCCGRDAATLAPAVAELNAAFPHAGGLHLPCVVPDFTDGLPRAAAEALVKGAAAEAGVGIDSVAHCAGITHSALLLRSGESDLPRLLNVNVTAPVELTRAVLRHGGMLRSGGGVCFVGSVVGQQGHQGQVAYAASKSALVGVAKSLSKEYGASNLRANVVAPGFIDTAMTASLPEAQKAAVVQATALRRFGSAEEVAEAVYFALTHPFFTGQVLQVDGGLAL